MFTAILWDYDGTLANTPVKNIAVTRAVLGRLDPALLDPLPDALSSLAAYQAANYRWRNWRELYQHALRVPADRLGLREGRFAYIGDHAGDIAFGRNAQAALRAMGRAAEVVCVAAAWGGAPSVDLAAADAVAARPADLPDLLADL